MTEPVKVLPMAKLLRLAREKEERERAAGATAPDAAAELESQIKDEETIPDRTIPVQTIALETPVNTTIVTETTVRQDVKKPLTSPSPEAPNLPVKRPKGKSVKRTPNSAGLLDVSKGYYPSYNDLSDRLIPELGLNPFEQSVLQRLYRLSRGWKSDECEVGLGTLAKFCVMSRSQVQRSVATLIDKGLIVNLGPAKKGSKDGNRYWVLPGVTTIPTRTMVRQTIVEEERTLPSENTEVPQTIVEGNTYKYNNKEVLKTQTQTPSGVRVGSKFSIEECRRFAESLRGEGIQNPGGYATTIYRSGEADDRVEAFLAQQGGAREEKPALTSEQIQEQANVAASMLRRGSLLEEVEQLLAGNFRPSQWHMIRSIALAQAKGAGAPAKPKGSKG